MENSKLLLLLKTFNASELRAFKDFVESPFFNKNQELVHLYAYLKKLASKGFPASKVQRAAVFAAVYPNEIYDEKRLNYSVSLLLKLAEQFISIQRYDKESIMSDYQLLNCYAARHLDKNYDYILQQTQTKLEASAYRNDEYYFQKHLLAEVADTHFLTKDERRFDVALQEASDYFDTFYLAKKLKYLCKLLDRKRTISSDYQINLLEEIKMYLQKHDFNDIPVITTYYQLLLMFTETQAEQYFQAFRQLLNQHIALFPPMEARELYQFAINFCIRQLRFGARQYYQILMELYLEGIENEALLEEGKISPWRFKNMVKVGLGLGRFDWVETFVKDYSVRLDADKRADAYHFNLADLHYHRKNYTQALFHLNQIEFSDIHYHLGAKVMLLKIYFETRETEALLSLIATCRVFLQRNKQVPKEVKMPYLNFVNLLHEVFRNGSKQANLLQEKIKTTTMLTDQHWLLQQLDSGR